MDVRSRRGRESSSPDRAKTGMQPRIKPIKKVQIVYYLTRNGQLEHPHYMEVTHLPNQPLRLKDVMDRLTLLRGKGMPSLYSWSCKRSYKNGYVWNDLADNDVIYPSDGAEYVLKGSELLEGCSEKFQQLHVSNRQQLIQEPTSYNLHSRTKTFTPNQHQEYQEDHQEDDCNEEDEEKTSYTSSTTPRSRCSRGVSTDELEDQEPHHNNNKIPNPNNPSSSNNDKNNTSKRFDDGEPLASEPLAPSRNSSVLLQLISCGNLAVAKAKNMPSFKQPSAAANNSDKNKNVVVVKKRGINDNLHKGVLCKTVVKVAEEEDKMIINYMSENPRFGSFQSEEKEYFSGSIVESASKDQPEIQPVLKKSNSYNEERSRKNGMGEAIMEVEDEKTRSNYAMKVKCIPRKKSSASSKKTRK
ncbi:hypothetical protein CISIN_1g015170mg [Citrus sinensis]|uniref:SOSEKI DIX-like domain-containing protein n=1 Tax=Citrus sinensis TaxID=2711 RepID=A0A067EZH3_CITSI|nr:hypothetical protein CISIN_1g015170mg [Citrus sinensis]